MEELPLCPVIKHRGARKSFEEEAPGQARVEKDRGKVGRV